MVRIPVDGSLRIFEIGGRLSLSCHSAWVFTGASALHGHRVEVLARKGVLCVQLHSRQAAG